MWLRWTKQLRSHRSGGLTQDVHSDFPKQYYLIHVKQALFGAARAIVNMNKPSGRRAAYFTNKGKTTVRGWTKMKLDTLKKKSEGTADQNMFM